MPSSLGCTLQHYPSGCRPGLAQVLQSQVMASTMTYTSSTASALINTAAQLGLSGGQVLEDREVEQTLLEMVMGRKALPLQVGCWEGEWRG